MAGKDSGAGGCQTKGIGDVLQGCGTGGAAIWVRDMGADPPHGTGPGKFPTQGRKADNRETAKETVGGGLEIPTAGSSNGGGSI